MKNIIKFVCVGALALGSVSCDLDIPPKTMLPNDDVTTLAYASSVRGGVYRIFRSIFMGEYVYYPDYQSDLFNELSSSGNRGGMMYRWNIYSSDNDVATNWNRHYAILANVNFLLDKIEAMYDGLAAEEQAVLDVYIGEMHLLRAMTLRSAALRYCKDYEPATAATDFGVPVVTTYDVTERPSRGSLADTYKRITEDIAVAERLVTTGGYADAAYVTADAVTAFKAQVYLDMHMYAEASAAASSLYASYPLVKNAEELENMWRKDHSTETIFQPAMTKNDLFGRYTDYHAGQWDDVLGDYRCDVAYIPEQWVCDLYDEENDWRYGPYVDVQHINNMADDEVVGVVLTKLRGNTEFQTSTNLNWYNMPKVLRIADMYLIDAEAKYRSGGDAAAPLNALRAARGLAATEATGDALFKEIQNERTREMIAEGGRIPDLKRWHIGFSRDKQTARGLLFGQTGHDMKVAADADRLVWPIPRADILSNPNLKGQQNPGWGE